MKFHGGPLPDTISVDNANFDDDSLPYDNFEGGNLIKDIKVCVHGRAIEPPSNGLFDTRNRMIQHA
jgi:hypothetical protein